MPKLLSRGLYGIAGPASDGPFARRREETLALAQAFAAAGAPVVQLRDKAAKVPELEAELAKARAELESARKPAESAPPAPTPPAGSTSRRTAMSA
jgi:hypothetical protein